MSMKILVVIPTHDRLQFIDDALASLRLQTRRADFVIVIGNVMPEIQGWYIACADGYMSLLENDLPFDVRLNQAVEDCRECDAFMILSDDDRLEPTYIERTAAMMESTGADVVTTSVRWFGDIGQAMQRSVHHIMGEPHVSSLVKKESWAKAGKFKGVSYFDQDLWMSMREVGCGKFVWVQEPLFWYRIHESQESNHFRDKDHERIMLETKARHEQK